MRGAANVVDQNLQQTAPASIEKKVLFVGEGTSVIDTLLTVNAQTDLNVVLGAASSKLKTQVRAAQLNGGQRWFAYVYPLDPAGTPAATVLPAILDLCSPELVAWCEDLVFTDAATLTTVLNTFASVITDRMNQKAQRIAMLLAVPGINEATQTWSAYQTLLTTAAAPQLNYRMALVPQLHGNNLGVLCGRLSRHDISIADSPMRVATGAVEGLGAAPVDMDGVLLPDAVLEALDTARYTVTQQYPDYPGTYFSDCNMLDGPTGDFKVIEYLRPLDKAARSVRLLMIARIADRVFNSTPASTEAHKTYFAKPLREMARTRRVDGVELPGEIMSPNDESVTIIWTSKTSVEVYLKLKPYDSPKDITTKISLDLSTPS